MKLKIYRKNMKSIDKEATYLRFKKCSHGIICQIVNPKNGEEIDRGNLFLISSVKKAIVMAVSVNKDSGFNLDEEGRIRVGYAENPVKELITLFEQWSKMFEK